MAAWLQGGETPPSRPAQRACLPGAWTQRCAVFQLPMLLHTGACSAASAHACALPSSAAAHRAGELLCRCNCLFARPVARQLRQRGIDCQRA